MDDKVGRLSHDAVRWLPNERPCPLCDSYSKRLMGRRGGVAHREGRGVVANIVRCRDCGAYSLPKPRGLAEVIEHKGLTAASWLGCKLGLGDGICCWARAV